jgi:CHAT domain-containing protein
LTGRRQTQEQLDALTQVLARKYGLGDTQAAPLAQVQATWPGDTDGSLGKVRYLHLATHGTVNWTSPCRPAIILSRDRLPDPGKQLDAGRPVYTGRLTAAAVLWDWNLDADLVTQWACETGLGLRVVRGLPGLRAGAAGVG